MRKVLHLGNKVFLLTFLVFVIFSFVGCNEFVGDQQTPSFIYVKGFSLVENPAINESSVDGFQSAEISDAWIYVDNEYIGTYTLPANVPILERGKHKIDVRPGVKLNGIAMTRTEYPFYTYLSQDYDLVEGKTIEIDTIDIRYRDDITVFALTELFENPYLNFTTDNVSSDSNLIVKCNNLDTVAYGSYCGAMYIGKDQSTYRIISDSIYSNNYSSLILEMDYWCNVPFGVGLSGRYSSSSAVQYINAMTLYANKDKGWQKVYIVLGKVWQQMGYPNNFKVYFYPQNPNNIDNGWVYIDNIKVIHRPNN
ncbi:MAG: hypothetical protein LBM25_00330 [Bacteroidales bacterium]|jgi:hypothetical protein|nr:hypothetical protein [Bacteroidales bacterium]